MMKWVLAKSDDSAVAALSEGEDLPPIIAKLLVNRGITEPAAARSFLTCDLSTVSDPGIFSHMEKAVSRIRAAINGKERVVIYGDYDVDGVTGSSLLYLALTSLGASVTCYIPDRMNEGYGINARALEMLRIAGAGLVISVDCGITALQEAETARALGLDLIITDHHQFLHPDPGPGTAAAVLPDAAAVLHPALVSAGISPGIRESVAGLTGVGMAFKLVQALMRGSAADEEMKGYLDLVTLGTVADVGRITGENRILVKHGLERLSSDSGRERPGIAALKEVAGLAGKKIGVGNVGFTIAPRINASGRLSRADTAFRLLTTDSVPEAIELASILDSVNKERQTVEEVILNSTRERCLKTDVAAAGALVFASEEWHPGVIGIVASRIVEEFYRPTALIHVNNGVGKGSARSIPGFDLYDGLAACSDLLLGFGGHKYAAGFTIATENIPLFRERLSSIVLERVGPQGFIRSLSVDGAVSLNDLTLDLMKNIDKLAPFGQGNPEPKLGARGLQVLSSRIVGNNHLKLRLRQQNGPAMDAIGFNKGDFLGRQVRDGALLAAVFTPRVNAWNGRSSVELDIRDIKADRAAG